MVNMAQTSNDHEQATKSKEHATSTEKHVDISMFIGY